MCLEARSCAMTVSTQPTAHHVQQHCSGQRGHADEGPIGLIHVPLQGAGEADV